MADLLKSTNNVSEQKQKIRLALITYLCESKVAAEIQTLRYKEETDQAKPEDLQRLAKLNNDYPHFDFIYSLVDFPTINNNCSFSRILDEDCTDDQFLDALQSFHQYSQKALSIEAAKQGVFNRPGSFNREAPAMSMGKLAERFTRPSALDNFYVRGLAIAGLIAAFAGPIGLFVGLALVAFSALTALVLNQQCKKMEQGVMKDIQALSDSSASPKLEPKPLLDTSSIQPKSGSPVSWLYTMFGKKAPEEVEMLELRTKPKNDHKP